jgi:hypothetical protein
MAVPKKVRNKVRINLKRIAKPLDSINGRVYKVIKTKDDVKKAKEIYKELDRIRKKLSSICCDNRWFCDL